MIYEMNLRDPAAVNFSPANRGEEIIQNVRTVLTTYRGTVPYDRSFGVDSSYVDDPIELQKARISAEIIELVITREPRASVTQIDFDEDRLSGKLWPKLRIEINESGV